MGKKTKLTNILAEENPAESSMGITAASTASTALEDADSTEVSSTVQNIGFKRKTAADEEKLEKYDALEKTVVDLQKEKEALEEKVTSYIVRLEKMKSSADEISKLKSEVEALKAKLKTAEDQTAKAKKDFAAARSEADDYLVKISELAFENAKMTAEMNELKKAQQKKPAALPQGKPGKKDIAERSAPNQPQFAPKTNVPQQSNSYLAQPRKDVYNPYFNNGYGSW